MSMIPKPPEKKIPRPPADTLDLYKKPPSAIDLEEVVLGAMLIDKRGSESVPKLKPEFFYLDRHSIVFKAIQSLYNSNIGIDLLTVIDYLKKEGDLNYIGGEFFLIQLTQKVSSSAHIDFHIHIIIQKYVLRELIKSSSFIIEEAYHYDSDIFDLLDRLQLDIERINKEAIVKDSNSGVLDAKEELEHKRKLALQGIFPGIPIGADEFDEWCGGFQPRELITIAARPGMGKTTVGVAISCNIAIDRSIPVAFFSLEMSKVDLLNRAAARLTSIPYSKIRRPNLLSNEEFKEVLASLDYLENSNLYILDTIEHKNTKEIIVKKIRELVIKGVKIVFIDYVQLIKLMLASGNRTDDLNTITRDLKALSNELNIPIVIFAQLNRSVESRTGNVPMLMDLKQSGSIEEDSDTVIFLLRKSYYDKKPNGIQVPPDIAGITDFIIAKGRSIGTRDFVIKIDLLRFGLSS